MPEETTEKDLRAKLASELAQETSAKAVLLASEAATKAVNLATEASDKAKELAEAATKSVALAEEAKKIADKALEIAQESLRRVHSLENDIFGDPARPGDLGLKGEMLESFRVIQVAVSTQTKQNWAILIGILGLIGTLVYNFVHPLH